MSKLLSQRKSFNITRLDMNEALMKVSYLILPICIIMKFKLLIVPHQCCRHGNVDCAVLLLKEDAYMDYQDDDLWTPLHMSAAVGHERMTRTLLQVWIDYIQA